MRLASTCWIGRGPAGNGWTRDEAGSTIDIWRCRVGRSRPPPADDDAVSGPCAICFGRAAAEIHRPDDVGSCSSGMVAH